MPVLGLQLLGPGRTVVFLKHPNVSVMFLLRLLGFVERGGLASVHFLPLLYVAVPYFLSPYHLNMGAVDFGVIGFEHPAKPRIISLLRRVERISREY